MKQRFMALICAAVISTSVFSPPVQELLGGYSVAEAASAVSTPASSRKSGTYNVNGSLSVKLSCKTKGAEIYYSVNSGAYKKYTKAISLKKNSTVKFYAKKDGVKSKTVTRTYRLTPKVTVTPDGGEFDKTQTVKLSSKTLGVKYFYTLDGTKPTTSSKRYSSGGIKITDSCKLRVLAIKNGWTKYYIQKSFVINSAKSENLLYNYTEKYGYSQLSANERTLYAALYNCANTFTEEINVKSLNVTINDLEKVYFTMAYDNPQLFWLSAQVGYTSVGSRVYTVAPKYLRTKTEAEKLKPQIEAAANELIAQAAELETDCDRVLFFHDEIVNSTKYTSKGGNHISEVDGPLLKGYALCEGYTMAFNYLCQSVGINCFGVAGVAGGTGHLWSMIELDGDWYHIDVTHDDPIGDEDYCCHDYFCVTEKEIKKTHTIDNYVAIPKATATECNYYTLIGVTKHDNADEAFEELTKIAARNYDSGIYRTVIYCDVSVAQSLGNLVYNNIFTELAEYGCYPKGASYRFVNSEFYLDLT